MTSFMDNQLEIKFHHGHKSFVTKISWTLSRENLRSVLSTLEGGFYESVASLHRFKST
jgi:hypothetical protein